MIARVSEIIFFGIYGLSFFVPIQQAGLILAVVAVVVAIALIVKA